MSAEVVRMLQRDVARLTRELAGAEDAHRRHIVFAERTHEECRHRAREAEAAKEKAQAEIAEAWFLLQNTYGVDIACDLAAEDEAPEAVTLDTAISQLGELAHGWRDERDALRLEAERLRAAGDAMIEEGATP